MSAGQAEEFPVHISGLSHAGSFDGLHTCVLGANEHWSAQQGLLFGSHTAPFLNLQVALSQQLLSTPCPGSQSSPFSTIPFPHIPSPTSWRSALGSIRQDVSVCAPSRFPRIEVPVVRKEMKKSDNGSMKYCGCDGFSFGHLQTLPILQGEKFCSPD